MVIENLENKKVLNPSKAELAEVGGDKKFGKNALKAAESAEAGEKEKVKKVLEALKDRKDKPSIMLKDLLTEGGDASKPEAVIVAKEAIKKAGLSTEEFVKKIVEEKSEQVKLERIKKVLTMVMIETFKRTDPALLDREVRRVFARTLKAQTEYAKSQFIFFVKMLRPNPLITMRPKEIVKLSMNVVEGGPISPSVMNKIMIESTLGVAAGAPVIKVMELAKVVPTPKDIQAGLLNPVEFAIRMHRKARETLKGLPNAIDLIRRHINELKFPGQRENEAITRLAHDTYKGIQEVGKTIGGYFEDGYNWIRKNAKNWLV